METTFKCKMKGRAIHSDQFLFDDNVTYFK